MQSLSNPSLRRRSLIQGATAVTAACIAPTVFAQAAAGAKPIRLIVPYPAGGAADLIGRAVADSYAARHGQAVVVENKPGAGGHLGAEYALQQPADGNVLVLATIAHNGAFKMYPNLRYDPARELVPLTLIAESPNVLLVRDGLPVKNIPELLALARKEPGKLNYGSAGNGSATHMAAELFKYMAKVDIVTIPFSGGAPALAALLGGQVDLNFETGSTAQQAIRSGRVRALGVTTPQRSPVYPDLPAVAEFVPGYAAVPWYTVSVSNKTPDAIANKLSNEISTVVRSPELAARWQQLGMIPLGGSREEAQRRNASETQKWAAVIDSARIRVE